MVGRPIDEVVDGIEVAVADGNGIGWDMPYGGLKDDGGSMEPCWCIVVGEMCEKAFALLPGIVEVVGVCGVIGVCVWLPGCP